jgi:hypothetical protein
MGSQRLFPGLIPQFSVLCVITMRKLMLFYVPYHVSGFFFFFWGWRKKNVLTVFLFLVFDWSWHNDQLIFDLQETDSPAMMLIMPTCWSKMVPLSHTEQGLSLLNTQKWQAWAPLTDMASCLSGRCEKTSGRWTRSGGGCRWQSHLP